MTDYAKLRQLAENATEGPWAWDQNRVPTLHGQAGDPDLYVYEAEVIEAEHSGECGCRSACELELNVSDADAKFIAAANPSTVLALLDELRDAKTTAEDLLRYTDELTATIGKLGAVLKERDQEIEALRRGQGRAPAPTQASPAPAPLHETHPIPDSTQPEN